MSELEKLRAALQWVLTKRIIVANGKFIQRDTVPSVGYGGWYEPEPIPEMLAEILESVRAVIADDPESIDDVLRAVKHADWRKQWLTS